jgi:APA family basic amino acid/polyamine antiporter
MGLFIAALVCVGDVRLTWSFSAFTVLIYYGMTNLAALRLPAEHRRFPRVFAYLGLAGCIGLAFFVSWQVVLAGLGWLAVGFGVRQGFSKGRESRGEGPN